MTEPHIHRWVLGPIKRFDVPGACACGEQRVFQGAKGFPSWAFSKHALFAKKGPNQVEPK